MHTLPLHRLRSSFLWREIANFDPAAGVDVSHCLEFAYVAEKASLLSVCCQFITACCQLVQFLLWLQTANDCLSSENSLSCQFVSATGCREAASL